MKHWAILSPTFVRTGAALVESVNEHADKGRVWRLVSDLDTYSTLVNSLLGNLIQQAFWEEYSL